MYKMSKYVHWFENEKYDYITLYHSVKISTIYVERSALEFVKKLKNEGVLCASSSEELTFLNLLVDIGFVMNGLIDETDVLDTVREKLKPCLSTMYLIVTDKCNLSCRYCFIEAGFDEKYECKDMNIVTAKKAIDMFNHQRNKNTDCQVWFYGGEPFLNADVVFECLDYIQEVGSDIIPVIISNGTLISEEIAFKLKAYKKLQISISIDGPETVNDLMRVYKDGTGAYRDAMAGINNLKKAEVTFGVSFTIGEHNVGNIIESACYIESELGVKSIGMNLLMDTPKSFVEEQFMECSSKGLIDFFAVARDKAIYEDRILRKVDAFTQAKPRWNDCAACGSQIVIYPSGEIGICHEGLGPRNSFIGSIDSPFDFAANDSINEWAYRSPATMAECAECEALGICGGGCPYGAYIRYGSIWNVDKRFCIHSKDTLRWLIWEPI